MAIHDDEDIAKCGVLRAAKLIESDLPPLLYEPRGVMHCGRQGMGVLHMMDAWRAPDSAVLNQGAIDSAQTLATFAIEHSKLRKFAHLFRLMLRIPATY
jgi:hypothetical protein